MLHLTYILQFIIHRFDDRSFPQQYFITHRHQAVFHVVADISDQMDTADEQYVGQLLGYISLVGKELSEYGPEKTLVFKGLPIVHICPGDGKIQYLSPIVDDDMQLEAIEPPHCRLSYFSNSFEHLVARNPFVMAHPYRSGVYKGYARTFTQTAGFQKNGHRHDHFLRKLYKAVVGHSGGEFGLHMLLHIEQVKVFHAPEPAQMEKDEYADDLAVAHCRGPPGFLSKDELFGALFKFLAEFIDNTENISNFIVVNHSGIIS